MTGEPVLLFPSGQCLITQGAMAALEEAGESWDTYFFRHLTGDDGDLCAEDKAANKAALKDGSRIFSAYHTLKGVKLYLITEWDRSCTTLLEASEY